MHWIEVIVSIQIEEFHNKLTMEVLAEREWTAKHEAKHKLS